jgi:hypothetical protein
VIERGEINFQLALSLSTIPAALQDTPEYRELMELLKAQRSEGVSRNERVIPRESLTNEPHTGYKVFCWFFVF